MNKKGFAAVGIIVLIIVIAGGIWYYEAYQAAAPTQNVPTATSTPPISETEAITIVQNLPDVKQWMASFTGPNGSSPTTGGYPAFSLAGETTSTYTIQVFENMPDHISTFGWYDVNKITGAATTSPL